MLQKRMARANAERGQSLVEFVFMAIVLGILLLGVLDLGRAYFTYMALLDAAGEGATYGSVNPTKWCNLSHTNFDSCPGDRDDSADPDNITYRVVNSAPVGTLVDWSQAIVLVESDPTIKPGRAITVTVTTDYQLLTPFVGSIVGSQILPLRAQASAAILSP
jgi:Flp pilus assembly protein TadG